jgi:hypothetical protein
MVYAPTRYDTSGASGKTSDLYNFSKNYAVLACETANTWAEIEVT